MGESAGAMVMQQQPLSSRMEAMPATTYSAAAPAATYIAGPQSGVMVGGTTMMGGAVSQLEGFLQHAMHTMGNAIGLGGSQATPTTTYVQGGGVTYGAPGAVSTTTTGGYAMMGGAGSASLFDQI